MITKILDRVNAENDTNFDYIESAIHGGYSEDVLVALLDYLEEREVQPTIRAFDDKYGGEK